MTAETVTATHPTSPGGLRAIEDVCGVVAEHAEWAEANRRLHPEVLDALESAGVFRLRTPARYGGLAASATTLLETARALSRAHGSTGWVAAVSWIPTYMACMLADEAQDEVFGDNPDVRICGTLSPGGAAVGQGTDLVLDGRWGFVSGALHADWMEVIAVRVDAGEPQPFLALVPMSELTIIDDWDVYGLAGTGSVSVVAEQVRIPAHRVLPLGAVLTEQYASEANRSTAALRQPLLPVAAATSAGVPLGIAEAARDTFLGRLPDRQITYTSYQGQAEAPVTHLQVAEATLLLDEAAFHAGRLAEDLDARSDAGATPGREWTLTDRVRARAGMAATVRRSLEAGDLLASASGGSSVYRSVPVQRHRADLQAINLHALMNPTTNLELFGRVLCGKEPNTLYL